MPAHDFLSDAIRTTLSQYILLNKSKAPSLPLKGHLPVVKKEAHYVLRASYTDNGANGMSAINRQHELTLRTPTILAEELLTIAPKTKGLALTGEKVKTVVFSGQNTSLALGEFDLTNVSALQINQKYQDWLPAGATFTLRVGSNKGKVLAASTFTYGKHLQANDDVSLTVDFAPISAKTSLFLTVSLAKSERR
ncbi:hypothetical protein RS130_12950 [Paraglaciecola aquimarina]|uniref:Uncharacterized protein n=2 Tax=Paraglaciecola aquimarina TaxID=1235557 RepID=A0ABU3SXF9_9ALTE|nr:hypothetical protein [Paraglaciecola aquimarina]MDU0354705.1 hypothetical protein [Paraglaciecola aquimarina]